MRNRIMHTVSKDMSLAARDVLDAHLSMYTGLFRKRLGLRFVSRWFYSARTQRSHATT